jgi:hypothetical protein
VSEPSKSVPIQKIVLCNFVDEQSAPAIRIDFLPEHDDAIKVIGKGLPRPVMNDGRIIKSSVAYSGDNFEIISSKLGNLIILNKTLSAIEKDRFHKAAWEVVKSGSESKFEDNRLQHSIFSPEDVDAIMVSLKTLGFEVNPRLQAQIMIALARSKNETKLMTIDTAKHQGAIMDM